MFKRAVTEQQRHDIGSLRLRYSRTLGNGANADAQIAIAHNDTQIGALGRERRTTLDVDIQYQPKAIGRHTLNTGVSLRVSDDRLTGTATQTITDAEDRFKVISGFVEDEIALTDQFDVTFGLRLDHHDFTGTELSPTARFLWNVGERQSFWGSLSRAARTPSRGERSFDLTAGFAPNGFPIRILGNSDLDSEQLTAVEFGYRAQWGVRLFGDVTLFHHSYDDLRTIEAINPITFTLDNGGELDLYGVELTSSLRLLNSLRLNANYAFNQVADSVLQDDEANAIPRHIATTALGWTISPVVSTNLTAYHVSRHTTLSALGAQPIDAFTSLNLAFVFKPNRQTTIRIVGQDLLETATVEAAASTPARTPIAVPRAFYLDLSRSF